MKSEEERSRGQPSNRGKQEETYQAIFWPLIIGILRDGEAVPQLASAGDECGGHWARIVGARCPDRAALHVEAGKAVDGGDLPTGRVARLRCAGLRRISTGSEDAWPAVVEYSRSEAGSDEQVEQVFSDISCMRPRAASRSWNPLSWEHASETRQRMLPRNLSGDTMG